MADNKTSTLNVSILDDNSDYFAGVTSNGDLKTISKIWDGTNQVDVTNNMLDVYNKNSWDYYVEQGKGYVADTGFVTISGTSENDIFLLKNPSGSGKTVRIKHICSSIVATVTGDGHRLKLYAGPTITSDGTALTINKFSSSQSASSMEAYYAPTISSRGTDVIGYFVGQGSSLVNTDVDLAFYLAPNENFLISLQSLNTGKSHSINVCWAEV